MNISVKVKLIAAILLALSVFASAKIKDRVIEERFKLEYKDYHPYIIPVKIARFLSFGETRLISNLYWLKLINYMGSNHYRGPDVQYRSGYPIAELVTDLDPRFEFAYEVSGTLLSARAWYFTRILEANCIYRKAQEQFPEDYRYYFWEAFNLVWYLGDEDRAVELLYKAAPYAPLPELTIGIANRITARTGRFETAIAMLQDSLKSVREETQRESIEKQIAWISAQKEISEVNEVIKRFIEENGKRPYNLQELVEKGYLADFPEEKFDGYYFINEHNELEHSKMGRLTPWFQEPKFADYYKKYKNSFRCRQRGEELKVNWPPVEGMPETTSILDSYPPEFRQTADEI